MNSFYLGSMKTDFTILSPHKSLRKLNPQYPVGSVLSLGTESWSLTDSTLVEKEELKCPQRSKNNRELCQGGESYHGTQYQTKNE